MKLGGADGHHVNKVNKGKMSAAKTKVEDISLQQLQPLDCPKNESEITENWRGDKIIVSILCPTYQHESFIQDAMDGFLAQVTRYRFEILVRDDASSDCTPEIITKYAQRFPNIVRSTLESQNHWPITRPAYILRKSALGKYIATCEGDDYWTDRYKLQKQVDFMETNLDCVMSHHEFVNVIVDEGKAKPTVFDEKVGVPIDSPRVCTRVYRNVFSDWPKGLEKALNGDHATSFYLKAYGTFKKAPGISPSVRRVHAKGIWSTKSKLEKAEMLASTWATVAEAYKGSDRYKEATLRKEISEYNLNRTKLTLVKSSGEFFAIQLRLIGLLSKPRVGASVARNRLTRLVKRVLRW